MPPTGAAVWSAIAATCSALAALMVMLIQRRNLLESARPELVVTGWDRQVRDIKGNPQASHEVITFSEIRNVGRGSALHVHVNASDFRDGKPPTYVMSSKRLAILAPNEGATVNCEISVWWSNARKLRQDTRWISIKLSILCWDSRSIRHETTYRLTVVPQSAPVTLMDEIAPGVMLSERKTEPRAIWALKLQSKIKSAVAQWRRRLASRGSNAAKR